MTRSPCTVIDLNAFHRDRARRRRREVLYVLLAVLPQRLCLATLGLYAVLRALLAPEVPFSCYTGPLFLLWPPAFLFLLVSYISDRLLWEA